MGHHGRILNTKLRRLLFCFLEKDKIRSIIHKITYVSPGSAILLVWPVLCDVFEAVGQSDRGSMADLPELCGHTEGGRKQVLLKVWGAG